MKDRKKLVEASWELFMQTGDPFYIMAKNTFEKDGLYETDDKKSGNGITDGKKSNKHNNNKGNLS